MREARLMVRNCTKNSPGRAPYDPYYVINPYLMKTKLYALKRHVLFIFLLLACGNMAQSQMVAKSMPCPNSPDGVIGFLQFTPSDYNDGQKHPLIVFMHGVGERGNGSASQVWNVAANGIPKLIQSGATMRFTVGGVTSSFVVLCPQLSVYLGTWPAWYGKNMIAYAKANLSNVDTNRIYVTGLSLGGGGSWVYGFDSLQNDLNIAALAPVCGTDDGNDANVCQTAAASHLPIWAFHCEDDGTVLYYNLNHIQGYLNACSGYTPAPRFTYYKTGGHSGAWNNAYDTGHITRLVDSSQMGATGPSSVNFTASPNLYEWFLMHTRYTGNTAPIASAGSAQTITLPTNSVSLTGTGTGTNGATISTYAWTQTSGPSTATITTPGNAGTTVTALVAGTYVFTLTVTDNHGLTNSSTVTITVNPANTPPTVSAGSAQTITLPTSSVSLTGTGAGTNGATVSTYAWTQTSGPSTGTITTPASATTTVTALVAGTYVFTLTVTDNHGLTNTSTVTITVNPASTPPTVSAGSTQIITLPASSVSLTGTAAGTNGATISTYAWTQTSGPSTATITTPGSAATTVTALVAGTYVFTLTVTDNHGLTNTSTVTITVNPANTPPTVSAGSAQIITLPISLASLTGTAAGTNGATISTYAWTQTSGPSTAIITIPGSATTTVTTLLAGTYVFTLTVTDNHGLTNSSTVTITVNPANTPPTVSAGSTQTITLPTSSVSLTGTAAGTNGATISTYAWTQTSGPSTAGITTPGSAATTITGIIQGTYVFTLTVTDNHGLSNSADVTITVNPANTAPVVDAGSNQTITLPVNSVSLSGTGTGTNGATISTYAWTQTSGPSTATIITPGSAATTVTGLIQGTYVFTLTVTDNHGLSNSASVTITVNPAPNVTPVANAGSNISLYLPQNFVSLDGSASYDPDGTIASYSWNKISGPGSVTILYSSTAKPSVIGLHAGVFVFELTVTDNGGATATARVQVTVYASNSQGLTANAGTDTSIALPASGAILNGTRSRTSAGTITAYSWTQVSGPAYASIANPGLALSAVTGLQEGQYVFMLSVTDNTGATDTATVHVSVVNAFRYSQYFKIYPNPVIQTTLNLQFIDDKTGRVKLTIIDESGRQVLTQEVMKDQSLLSQQINVGNLGKGVYFLRIEQSDGTRLIRQFVKQ